MTSIERILQYTTLSQEPLHGVHPPVEWPSNGTIQMMDVALTYPPENRAALRDINIAMKSNEKVC